MRRISYILALFLCIMCTVETFAQDFKLEPLDPNANKNVVYHARFKGFSINGKLEDFVAKLEKDGFSLLTYVDGTSAVMKGIFAGKEATIYVLSTPKTHTVWKVAAFFEKYDSWSSLENAYLDFKGFFIQKYGAPNTVYEKFVNPYDKGDGYELQAVRNSKCEYYSLFNIPNGLALVSISSDCCVLVSYEDSANVLIKQDEESERALNDI